MYLIPFLFLLAASVLVGVALPEDIDEEIAVACWLIGCAILWRG